jgi:hypothetical protein
MARKDVRVVAEMPVELRDRLWKEAEIQFISVAALIRRYCAEGLMTTDEQAERMRRFDREVSA